MSDLRPYQEQAVEAAFTEWESVNSTLICLPTGCHARGQGILMFDGTVKPVEAVVVGDLLMGMNSQPRIVRALAHGVGKMFRIVPTKGDPFVVNEDHVLTLVRTNEASKPKHACDKRGGEIVDVRLGDYLKWSKYKKHIHKLFRCAADFAPHYRSYVAPYFAGIMLGDGSSQHTPAVTTADDEIIREVLREAKKHGLKVRGDKAGGKAISIYMTSGQRGGVANRLTQLLRGDDLWGYKCEQKFIPIDFKCGHREVRLEVLAGLIDTDGSLSNGGYDFISASKQLSDDVAFVARSLGLAAYARPCKKNDQHGTEGIYHRVFISGDCSIIPCRIARKKAPHRKQIKNVLRTGFAVEPVGTGEYFGFTIDGDGRYLLDDFTVTHNSGKTFTAAHIIKQMLAKGWGRCLWMVHRQELVDQAAEAIEKVCGRRTVDIEMADRWADQSAFWKAQVIVSSVQTLTGSRGGRMERFDPNTFGLVVVDEAHHITAPTYRKVIDHFQQNQNIKLLGLTATPDRADEEALGQVLESVAFNYEIMDAINDGWLVTIEQQFCVITGLDFSRCGTVAGDFNQGDLAQVMEEERPLCEVVSSTLEIAAGRRTLVFAASVLHAEKMAALFNNAKPECAQWVCGETPLDERKKMFDEYRAGKFQILVNVGIVTEGTDVPGIEVVAMARPTKSRSLYAQMSGRALRPLSGLVDGIETVRGRLMAINGSSKPHATIIDYVGNSGKHKLVNSADLLGGKESDEVVERANEIMHEKQGMMTQDAIEQARDELEKEREKSEEVKRIERTGIVAKTTYYLEKVDPFGIFDLRPQREKGWDKIRPVTEKQKAILTKQGIDFSSMNATEMKAAINAVFKRIKDGKCNLKQAKLLRRYNIDPKDVGFKEASGIIDAIAQNGWRLPESLKSRQMEAAVV